MKKPRIYIDMVDTLIQWEDNPKVESRGTKEVFCGVTHTGEELIRFASPIDNPLTLLTEMRKYYEVFLISSNPKIYTSAINETFKLGFSTREMICAEEYLSPESGTPDPAPYQYKVNNKDRLLSLSPKNSVKCHKQRSYLSIEESRQINFQEMQGILKKRIEKLTRKGKERLEEDLTIGA